MIQDLTNDLVLLTKTLAEKLAPLLTHVPKNNEKGLTLPTNKPTDIDVALQQPTYKEKKKQQKKNTTPRKQQRMMQLIHHGHLASAINQQRSERFKDRNRGLSKYNIALINQRRRERLKDRNRGYNTTNIVNINNKQ